MTSEANDRTLKNAKVPFGLDYGDPEPRQARCSCCRLAFRVLIERRRSLESFVCDACERECGAGALPLSQVHETLLRARLGEVSQMFSKMKGELDEATGEATRLRKSRDTFARLLGEMLLAERGQGPGREAINVPDRIRAFAERLALDDSTRMKPW